MTPPGNMILGILIAATFLGAVLKMDEMSKEREMRQKAKENQR